MVLITVPIGMGRWFNVSVFVGKETAACLVPGTGKRPGCTSEKDWDILHCFMNCMHKGNTRCRNSERRGP
jgi:hypothetical protein